MDGEKRYVFPGGVADGADKTTLLAYMCGDTRKMESVSTFGCVNGRTLTSLNITKWVK